MTFGGLHGIISQKRELFIATAVRTSDPGGMCVIRETESEVKQHLDEY
jgi:hypothetical protein